MESQWTVEKALAQHGVEPLATDSLASFYTLASRLKQTKRTGWLRYGIKAETVAEHSGLMGLLTFSLPSNVQAEKCMKMCLVHDLAEALVGDLTPYSKVPRDEKARREAVTFDYIAEQWPRFGDSIRAVWREFEERDTIESQHANDLDKLEMMFQAFEYEKSDKVNLEEFFRAAEKVVTSWGKKEAEALLKQRKDFRDTLPDYYLKSVGEVSREEVQRQHDALDAYYA